MQRKKTQGISLLELLLSLTIIAILLVMATRYYTSVRSEQQVNDAFVMVKQILGAGDNWYDTYKNYDNPPISIPALQNLGLLPSDLKNNPWGQSIDINQPPAVNYFSLSTVIPSQGECENLRLTICKAEPVFAIVCSAISGGDYQLSFNYPAGSTTPRTICTTS